MIEIKNKSLSNYTFIDLFAGIGGFRLALESLGANCVFSSEWDKHASKVYYDNFGDMPQGDITKICERNIPDHDILCAGFPCQAFSISGNQAGFEDSRGTLFFDVARIIREKKPKVVFMENVKNFTSHDNGKTLEVVKSTLDELDYTFDFKVISATDFGIPQKRERVYMVCFRKDLVQKSFEFPKTVKLDRYLEDFLLDQHEEISELIIKRSDFKLKKEIDKLDYSNAPIKVGIVNKGGQGERVYSPKGVAITLSSTGGGIFSKTGGYLVNGNLRKLHYRECARIMGYPEYYLFTSTKSQSYKQLGNSVVIDVLQYIASGFSLVLQGDK